VYASFGSIAAGIVPQFSVAQCESFASLHPENCALARRSGFVQGSNLGFGSFFSRMQSEKWTSSGPHWSSISRGCACSCLRYDWWVRGPSSKSKSAKAPAAKVKRIFLLSPANAAGKRAQLLMREGATFDLARRLQNGGLALGEAFSFISGLYFRGKLAYANAFACAPDGLPGALVITACGGLLPPETPINREQLCLISAAPVEASEPRYRIPLERDARLIASHLSADCEVVLLGSIATPKYVEPLLAIFGERLVFPVEFAGRGDMSRGGLMLRCVRQGIELNYISIATGKRHGPKPAKLPRLSRAPAARQSRSSAERFSR
jgi:hypothetical protein